MITLLILLAVTVSNKMIVAVGGKIGRLLITKRLGSTKHGVSIWECKCACGNIIEANTNSLTYYKQSCGCLHREKTKERAKKQRESHLGEKYGYLEIVGFEKGHKKGYLAVCKCHSCNNTVNKSLSALKNGVKSCGCKTDELKSLAMGGTGIPHETKTLQEIIRESHENRNLIHQSLITANFLCSITKQPSNQLEAHHIVSLSAIIKQYKITKANWMSFKEVLFDPTNLIVLDKKYHRKFHTLYGNMPSRKQLDFFIREQQELIK